ncbi:S1C family serine protease [Allorhodopirellula heiligendammensis]|uniref:Periplasmic serine endoprotease DegP-like n=1 Tax=Allorhodopirellula heiligendammensis TaxID=2714739 RepID=A0A5C6BGI9_9BACT|nr:PDZ domain-containing protein [Allorhodopirellula heiligendammensis]TWU10757.1 putative periplasmic serine endoprotease DegP-like precursor [Allorhodopirellula heiligendammensis]
MIPQNRFLLFVLGCLVVVGSAPRPLRADDAADDRALPGAVDYQSVLAEQVRRITNEILPSVVSVEVIGTLQSDGEVRQDAPTCGVIIDREGHVLASSWVTRASSASIIVTLGSGERLPARVVAEDKHRELVLLKIDPKQIELHPIALESTDSSATAADPVRPIGSTLIAISRYGESGVPRISTGILSAVDRLGGTAIQSDVRISPVFYGGPLVDLHGKLVGVLIPAVGESGAEDPTEWYDSGVAFAVPADVIAGKLDALRSGETIRSGLLGLVVGGDDPYSPGTTLATVRKRSPADRAGLQSGDRLIRVGGREVRRRQEVQLALGRFDAGEEVAIEYERDGQRSTATATLAATIEPLQPQYLGITSSGLRVTSVLPGSPADGILKIGDNLKSLDGKELDDPEVLRQRMWSADPQTPQLIELERQLESEPPETLKQEIQPAQWAGPLDRLELQRQATKLTERDEDDTAASAEETWTSTPMRLPDIANQALLWHPVSNTPNAAADAAAPVALAVCLLPPVQRDLAEQLKRWKVLAKQYRVAILLIASENEQRWQLAEIDAISKLTLPAIKQSGADASAVAVLSGSVISTEDAKAASPAGAMALAAALSTDNIYHGLAIPANTQPPAIRLRRDAPMRLLRVLMTTGPDGVLPSWSETLGRLGCPVQTATGVDREELLQWCRSLLIY